MLNYALHGITSEKIGIINVTALGILYLTLLVSCGRIGQQPVLDSIISYVVSMGCGVAKLITPSNAEVRMNGAVPPFPYMP